MISEYFDHLIGFAVVLVLGVLVLVLFRRHDRFTHISMAGVMGAAFGFMFALLLHTIVGETGRNPLYSLASPLPQTFYAWTVGVIDAFLNFIFSLSTGTGAALGLVCGCVFPQRRAS
jgi:hypothetical protein